MGMKFLSRFFSNRNQNHQNESLSRPCLVEPLEKREFLTLTVASMLADNRGSVLVTLGGDANPATVHRTSVQVYTTGPDGRIYTADDTFVPSAVRYVAAIRRISINFSLPANTQYRVKLVSSRIRELGTNAMLDGEFNGTFPTGNGVPGGNTEFTVVHDRSATPIVRMSTSKGVITLRVLRGLKPKTASHFLSHVNSGDYDNIFFTRNIPGFIIQTGSLKIDQSNNVVQPNAGPTLQNEFTTNPISNTRGTLAFAKGFGPDSATNQFFFNLGNNGPNLDNQNEGFTVFAQVANAASLAVMDAIAGLDTVALHNDVTGNGVLPNMTPTGLTHVPINDIQKYPGGLQDVNPDLEIDDQQFVVTGNFDPSADTVIIGRTAMLYRLQKLTS